MEEKTSQVEVKEPLRIRKANDYAEELKNAKPPEMLFDEFWREGELALLFGASGAGKSILAVQIAEALARGRAIDGFRMPRRGQQVLYLDMEMSGVQFVRRNSAIAARSNNLKAHEFSKRFLRESPPDVEKLAEWLRQAVKEIGCRVVVIDSLAAVRTTQDGVRETLKLMRGLRRIKDELDISILVLTDAPAMRRGKALNEADLGRSRVICSAADSVFAICSHPTHFDHRYILQTRSRNAPVAWTERNAPLCSITKAETGLLAFRFDDRFIAKLDDDELELISNLKQARDEGGESFRSMAELFEITRSRAERLYKKWSPAIEAKYRSVTATMPIDDESEPPAVAGGLTQHIDNAKGLKGSLQPPATAGGSDQIDELDEFEEAGIERPVWLEMESNGELKIENGEVENTEEKRGDSNETNPHSAVRDTQSEIPFAAALRRRSVYELKRDFDAYGREIFIEKECEPSGKPEIWYRFDRKGKLIKTVRGRAGIMVTHLGPGPYL